MRILVLQNHVDDDAAYFATFLRKREVAFDTVFVGDGATLPTALTHYSALVVLGGPNSVNDDDPALRHIESLIREADETGKPVLGHCLGGQLIASALGGKITTNAEPEVGWSSVTLEDSDIARQWFGELAGSARTAFQWHYETFSLPDGATLLAGNSVCAHQAFAYKNTLAMQFHIEVDEAKLKRWSLTSDDELLPLEHLPTVQIGIVFAEKIPTAIIDSKALADRIYARFLTLAQRRERAD
jgi:GMP synthase (glutamine-hydrolysing)